MAELPINADICEVNKGAFYTVRLDWVPRVGELIDLFSFIDQADGNAPKHYYEVVQVVHKLHDMTEKVPQANKGHHYVSVFVKPATREFPR